MANDRSERLRRNTDYWGGVFRSWLLVLIAGAVLIYVAAALGPLIGASVWMIVLASAALGLWFAARCR